MKTEKESKSYANVETDGKNSQIWKMETWSDTHQILSLGTWEHVNPVRETSGGHVWNTSFCPLLFSLS